jgi:DNA-binding NtrC family response regulator
MTQFIDRKDVKERETPKKAVGWRGPGRAPAIVTKKEIGRMKEPHVSIVIIDDNPASLELLSTALDTEGLQILTATDPEEGLETVFRVHPQIVITDLMMPGITGMDVLDRIVAFDPAIDVILISAHGTPESAVEAIRKGAADFLSKPLPLASLRERTSRLIEDARRRNRGGALEHQIFEAARFEGMVGRSPALLELSARIRRIAPHYRTVLISGPTGTGKDLAARAIHNLSPVSKGHFVVLNCSAVVETLFESELFGHVRGSFTGANQDKMGLFEFADKGTLFLDEIGDMPLSTQAKLLRTLQNQEVLRVGSLTARKVNVRVVAATNRDLRLAVANKQFREDPFYRLSMIELRTPPLAERKEDLPLLIKFFVEKFAQQFQKNVRGLTQRAQIVLARHSWPGNIRELENAIGHGCMMTASDMIDVADLPEYLMSQQRSGQPAESGLTAPEDDGSFESHERQLVAAALTRANGNQSEAARFLRIGRDALRYKMKKHGLEGHRDKALAATAD